MLHRVRADNDVAFSIDEAGQLWRTYSNGDGLVKVADPVGHGLLQLVTRTRGAGGVTIETYRVRGADEQLRRITELDGKVWWDVAILVGGG